MDSAHPLDSPSLSRRQFLNFLTGSAVAATVAGALYPHDCLWQRTGL